jgi:hypothetical protein
MLGPTPALRTAAVLACGLTRTFLVHSGLQLPDAPTVTGRLDSMKHVVRVIPRLHSRAKVAILPMRKLRNHPDARSPHDHDGPKLRGVAAGAGELDEVNVRNDFAV